MINSLKATGSPVASLCPSPVGPRNCGQFSAAKSVAAQSRAAVQARRRGRRWRAVMGGWVEKRRRREFSARGAHWQALRAAQEPRAEDAQRKERRHSCRRLHTRSANRPSLFNNEGEIGASRLVNGDRNVAALASRFAATGDSVPLFVHTRKIRSAELHLVRRCALLSVPA